MHRSATPLAVCLSVAMIHDTHYGGHATATEAYNILRLNFAHVTPTLVEDVTDYLHRGVPQWMSWLVQEKNHNGGILWLFEYMKEGGLSRQALPEYECTMGGLAETLKVLLALSRRWAVGQGLSKKRSFERTREGDRYGYGSNSKYPWYDHPGNSGY